MEWDKLEPATTMSIPDRLSIDIERLILRGELAPGERLPAERELAERLRVSRVSIRQALHELESRGLIDRRPGRGTIVLSPADRSTTVSQAAARARNGTSELQDLMELREIVEPPIARLAASRATGRDIEQLRELVREMDAPLSKEAYAELDRAFHQAIAQYTHNPHLAAINESIAESTAPVRANRLQTAARRAISTEAHRRIFAAIAAGDAEAAEETARAHVFSITRQLEQPDAAPQPLSSEEISA